MDKKGQSTISMPNNKAEPKTQNNHTKHIYTQSRNTGHIKHTHKPQHKHQHRLQQQQQQNYNRTGLVCGLLLVALMACGFDKSLQNNQNQFRNPWTICEKSIKISDLGSQIIPAKILPKPSSKAPKSFQKRVFLKSYATRGNHLEGGPKRPPKDYVCLNVILVLLYVYTYKATHAW